MGSDIYTSIIIGAQLNQVARVTEVHEDRRLYDRFTGLPSKKTLRQTFVEVVFPNNSRHLMMYGQSSLDTSPIDKEFGRSVIYTTASTPGSLDGIFIGIIVLKNKKVKINRFESAVICPAELTKYFADARDLFRKLKIDAEPTVIGISYHSY